MTLFCPELGQACSNDGMLHEGHDRLRAWHRGGVRMNALLLLGVWFGGGQSL